LHRQRLHTHWSLTPGLLNVPSRMGSASHSDTSCWPRILRGSLRTAPRLLRPPPTPSQPPPLASRASSLTPNLRRGGGAHRLSAPLCLTGGKAFHASLRSAQPTGHAELSTAIFFWGTGGFSVPHVCNGACLLAQNHLIRLISSRIMCRLHEFAHTVLPTCVPSAARRGSDVTRTRRAARAT